MIFRPIRSHFFFLPPTAMRAYMQPYHFLEAICHFGFVCCICFVVILCTTTLALCHFCFVFFSLYIHQETVEDVDEQEGSSEHASSSEHESSSGVRAAPLHQNLNFAPCLVWSSLVLSSLVQSSLVQSSLVQSSLVQSRLVQSSLVQSSLVQSSLV